jgi:hypothetical protein
LKKEDFKAIAVALTVADVPFITVGGIAVNEHGYGRNTFDVDLVIGLTPAAVLRAFSALEQIGYRPRVPVTAQEFSQPEERARLIEEKGMKVLNFWSERHPETPLDIFVTEPFDFAKEYARAHVRELAPEVMVRIVTLPVLFEMKKTAGRPKDLADLDELSLLHGLPSSYDKPE